MSAPIRFYWDGTTWEAQVKDGEVAWMEAIMPTYDRQREIRTRAELLYRWKDLMLLRQHALDQDQARAKEMS